MQAVQHYHACEHAGRSAWCHLHSLHTLRYIEDIHDKLTTTLYRRTSQSKSQMTWRKGVIMVTSLSPHMPTRSSVSSQRRRTSGASMGTFVAGSWLPGCSALRSDIASYWALSSLRSGGLSCAMHWYVQISGFRFHIVDSRFQISDCRFQIPDFIFQIWDLRFQNLHFRF